MFAEHKDTGEIVGGALTLLDYNQMLAKLNGRLLPFGWIRALRERRRIDTVRVIVLGVMPAYRHTGVATILGANRSTSTAGRANRPWQRRVGCVTAQVVYARARRPPKTANPR